jgi:Zn-dependent metalloprotease
VKFQQLCKGLPTYAGELVVQLDGGNRVVSVNGAVSPACAVDATATVTADDAQEAASELVAELRKIEGAKLVVTKPELTVYNPALIGSGKNENLLVWKMEVKATDLSPVRELVMVDAKTGAIAFHYDKICKARDRMVYDKNNDYTSQELPGTPGELKRSEGGALTGITDVDNAYDFAGDTYDFFLANHGRDSLDNTGMSLINTVRYCPDGDNCPFYNAFWNGQQMVFGNNFASADDVVAHELTHGVTEHESNLEYWAESGAINESFSDLWGEFVDLTNGKGNDAPDVRWLMGEDLAIGAGRNMADPTAFGQPDRMGSPNYYCGTNDNGGVHTNSGVNNKAVFLMTDGGTFNGITVRGLGIAEVAKIYYEAQSNILTSASQYTDLYNALQLACSNLTPSGVTSAADCDEVKKALDAVEMSAGSGCSGLPNLTPYQPMDWSDKIVVSNTTGTTTDSTRLSVNDDLFIDWAVANDGAAATPSVTYFTLYVDGVENTSWYYDYPLYPGEYVYVLDYALGKLSAGIHTLTIVADPQNYIAESDESDNSYTKTITVFGENYSLSGTVHSGTVTEAPLAGATVNIAGKTAVTSSDGTFRIADIPGGIYTLSISKDGYATYTDNAYAVTSDQSGVNFYLVPLYSMSGTVRSGNSWGPAVAGAVVAIAGKTATTSSTGTFSITGIPAGTHTLTIAKTGYGTYTDSNYAVTSDQSGLKFYLAPLNSVSGTVRAGSSTGPLLTGATVSIAGQTTTTSSRGAFCINGIPSGTYTVSIAKSGYKTLTTTLTVSYNKVVSFYLVPAYTISGTVRSGSGNGPVVAGALVSIGGMTATTSSTGTFSIGDLAVGSYTLTISKDGYKTYSSTYTVTGNRSGVSFSLAPICTMSGTVRAGSATGPTLAGAVVNIAGKSVTTSSTGTFSIAGIVAGTYSLTISKAGYRTYATTYTVTANQSGLTFYLAKY